MTDQYEPFDLGAFDEDLKGQTIDLLRNPTRGFRFQFLRATGDELVTCILRICNLKTREELEAKFADYDQALFVWLFIITMDGDKVQLPYLFDLWDEYVAEKIKKLRSPSPPPKSKASGAA